MKTTMILLMCLVIFLPNAHPEDYTRRALPEDAVARLGRGTLEAMQYSPDGRLLAVSSPMGLWFYDGTTYEEIALLPGNRHSFGRIAFSPDGKLLASGGLDTVQLWDPATRELKRPFELAPRVIISLAFSPDGETLAAGLVDGSVQLWDVATGKQIRTLATQERRILNEVFTAVTGRPLQPLTVRDVGILSVVFSPDGKLLASGGRNKQVWLWDLSTGKRIQRFKGHEQAIAWHLARMVGRLPVGVGTGQRDCGMSRQVNISRHLTRRVVQ